MRQLAILRFLPLTSINNLTINSFELCQHVKIFTLNMIVFIWDIPLISLCFELYFCFVVVFCVLSYC